MSSAHLPKPPHHPVNYVLGMGIRVSRISYWPVTCRVEWASGQGLACLCLSSTKITHHHRQLFQGVLGVDVGLFRIKVQTLYLEWATFLGPHFNFYTQTSFQVEVDRIIYLFPKTPVTSPQGKDQNVPMKPVTSGI